MRSSQKISKAMIIISMVIFSTIGILRRHIPYSSSIIALVRGCIGTVFLLLVVICAKKPLNRQAIKSNMLLLIFSGAAIGFNWIFLFEAYNYTTVATATLCYYLAPIFVILLAPLVLKERLTLKKSICALCALVGIVLVSGVLETDSASRNPQEIKGIIFGLAAAVLYGSVILMNKKMKPIPPYDKTILQLAIASAVLVPYVLLTESVFALSFDLTAVILLLVAGIVHTGIAYAMYFSSMDKLSSNTIALFSYIDPVLAVVLSMVLLNEPMSFSSVIGAILILSASIVNG